VSDIQQVRAEVLTLLRLLELRGIVRSEEFVADFDHFWAEHGSDLAKETWQRLDHEIENSKNDHPDQK
jgi:uncharacterized protein VirK/YbjX